MFLWRRKLPFLLVGWLWYIVMLLPVIGIIQVGLQARADRYTYLPQIGVIIAVVWAIHDLTSFWRARNDIGACVARSSRILKLPKLPAGYGTGTTPSRFGIIHLVCRWKTTWHLPG